MRRLLGVRLLHLQRNCLVHDRKDHAANLGFSVTVFEYGQLCSRIRKPKLVVSALTQRRIAQEIGHRCDAVRDGPIADAHLELRRLTAAHPRKDRVNRLVAAGPANFTQNGIEHPVVKLREIRFCRRRNFVLDRWLGLATPDVVSRDRIVPLE